MKKFVLASMLVCCFAASSFAQFELKINPIGLLFNSPDVSAEYLVTDDFGAELGIGLDYGKVNNTFGLNDLKKSGFSLFLAGKYYFNPDDGCDKFYAGAYIRSRTFTATDDDDDGTDYSYKRNLFGAGIILGYKWVSARGILFEIAFGGGKAFVDNFTFEDDTNSGLELEGLGIDILGRLAVGYRFSQ